MGFRGCKSRVKYAKTENRLLEASSHIDFDAEQNNTYDTFFWTLQQVWAPSDFSSEKVNFLYTLCTKIATVAELDAGVHRRLASFGVVWLGSGLGIHLPIALESG